MRIAVEGSGRRNELALRGAIARPKANSYAAITNPLMFEGLLCAIAGFDGHIQTVAALPILALVFPRPGELRMGE